MRTRKSSVVLLTIGLSGLLGTGCGAESPGDDVGASTSPTASVGSTSLATGAPDSPTRPGTSPTMTKSTSSPDSPTSPTRTKTTSATEKLLLPEQIQLQEGGDGLGPGCSTDDAYPDGFSHDPGVWLNTLYSPTEYPYIVVLCLRGFQPKGAIELRLSSGDFTATTHVVQKSGAPEGDSDLGYEEEPSTTLFEDGATLNVYAKDYGGTPVTGPPDALVTEMWTFYPPRAARDAIADSGAIELTAVQEDLTARIKQPIPLPTSRAFYRLTNNGGGNDRLVLVGYPEGASVPIGLYRRQTQSPEASLVDELGRVKVPRSRLVSYELSHRLLSARPMGTYCLAPPVEKEASCEAIDNWPPYPGKVSVGDTGSRVRKWQDLLIGADIISDRPANHDGVYGEATNAAVNRFFRQHDDNNPDGDGVLGRQTYDRITG